MASQKAEVWNGVEGRKMARFSRPVPVLNLRDALIPPGVRKRISALFFFLKKNLAGKSKPGAHIKPPLITAIYPSFSQLFHQEMIGKGPW